VLASPDSVLAAREGTLAETPLPALLQAIAVEGLTVSVDLKVRALEKRIQFEEGSPVACRSNLLHETLGKFLVEKGKIAEADYQRALGESVQSGKRMGEVLVSWKLVQPFDLYRLMQANLALKILDAFRWVEASWRISEDAEQAELSLRMNPAQLVLTGVSSFLPFDVVSAGLPVAPGQRFTLERQAPHQIGQLKLSPKEARLVQALRGTPTFEDLTAATGLEVEDALRRLYALTALGFVRTVEVAQAGPAPRAQAPAPAAAPQPAPAAPEPAPAPAAPESTAILIEETDELRNALAARWLAHRGQDPFDLLGVAEGSNPAGLRAAFLDLADRFAPLRFASADLREKAEALLAATARAYGALADPEQAALWKKRRTAAAEKARGAPAIGAAEAFRIRTTLLDAGTQFSEGLKRLQAGEFRAALDLFQYAADIEPRASHRAHLAWARYLVDPERHARLALRELGEVARGEPSSFDAAFFTAEIQRGLGSWAEAEESYRRAQRANPKDPRPQALALEMMRMRKAAR
jgi:tetratricopeptide (TPR) repeat protein